MFMIIIMIIIIISSSGFVVFIVSPDKDNIPDLTRGEVTPHYRLLLLQTTVATAVFAHEM